MKISKLKYIAWLFFALMLASITTFSLGFGNGKTSNNKDNGDCLNNISGLTEEQQQQIVAMEEKHHETMAAFRTKRRSTTNTAEKSEIRTEMLKIVEAHRNSVKTILNADQQKQYELLHHGSNRGRNQQFVQKNGNRHYRGHGNGRFNNRTSCVGYRSQNIDTCGFEVIEETEFNN